MRHSIPYAFVRFFMLNFVLILALTSSVSAQEKFSTRVLAVDDKAWFDPQDTSLTLVHSDLLANDSGTQGAIVLLEQDAVHGTVTQQGNTFVYTPSASFWSLKGDSFAYKISGFGGESTATVRIFRFTPQQMELEQGFEAAETINYTEIEDPGSTVDVNAGSALLGGQGLQTSVGAGSSGHAAASFPITGDTTDNGGTVLLGGGLNQGGGNGGDHEPDFEIAILTVGPPSEDLELASVRVILESLGGTRTLRVDVRDISVLPNVFVSSTTLPVTEDVNHIALEWWAQGAILDLNGQAVRVAGLGNAGLPFNYVRVGAMPLSGAIAGGADFHYDGFEVRGYDDSANFPLILGEGFEENMGSWNYEIGSGMDTTSVAPTGAQALEGNVGVGDSFVISHGPDDELALNARLRVDVSQMQLSASDWISFLQLGSMPNSILHRDDVQLRLQEPAGQPQVGIASFVGSAWTQPGWFPLSGEHVLEVQVQNSPTSVVDCGYVRLWIDGAPMATIYGIDSVNRLTDWMRLGPQQVDPASTGVLIFDDVELWR